MGNGEYYSYYSCTPAMLLSHLLGSEISLEEILARMTGIARQIHYSCELGDILNITVREIREILGCDRVASTVSWRMEMELWQKSL